MLRKKERKPQYHKMSKAQIQTEEDFFSESEEESFIDTQSEFNRPAIGRRKIYEHSNFEDDYGMRYGYQNMHSLNDMYTTDNSVYNMEHDVDEYTSQMSMYNEPNRHKSRRERRYEQSEMESCDDSDSDCKICSNGMKCKRKKPRPNKGMNDYISEYSYQPSAKYKSPKNNCIINRKTSQIHTDTETSPYRQDVNHVYLARPPVGHRAFTYKQQMKGLESSSEEETESDTPVKENKVIPPNKSQYHVYAADVPQDPAGVFNQGLKERLLSVTNYDGRVPMVALKDDKKDSVIRSNSGIVYLPVIVLDQAIKLPKNKVVGPETILTNSKENTQRPLETNTQVYVAMETKQGNIFQKEKNQLGVEKSDYRFPQEIATYVISQTSGNPIKSVRTRAPSKNEKNQNEADYPVQKPYINVVSTTPSSSDKSKKSKFKLRKAFSTATIKSLFGKGPSSSAKENKKNKKAAKVKKRKNKKKTDDEFDISPVASVADTNSLKGNVITTNQISDDRIQTGNEPHNLKQSVCSPSTIGKGPIANITKNSIENNIIGSMVGNTLPPNIGQGIEETRYKKQKDSKINSFSTDTYGNTANITKSVIDRKSVVDEKKKSILGRCESKDCEKKKSIREDKGNGENQSLAQGKENTVGGKRSSLGGKPNIFVEKKYITRENQSITGAKLSVLGEKQQTHGTDMWKSEPNMKPTRDDLTALASEPIYKTEAKLMNTERKSLASQIISYDRKKRDQTIDKDVEIIPLSTTNNLYANNQGKDLKKIPNENNNTSMGIRKTSATDQSRLKPRRKSSKYLKKTVSTRQLEETPKPALKLWGYISFIEYFFVSVQFFLGMSLHDILMEVSHNYTH